MDAPGLGRKFRHRPGGCVRRAEREHGRRYRSLPGNPRFAGRRQARPGDHDQRLDSRAGDSHERRQRGADSRPQPPGRIDIHPLARHSPAVYDGRGAEHQLSGNPRGGNLHLPLSRAAERHLGWEAWGWIGGDFNKFWWKNEGEAVFEGPDEGETETDLLYSRPVTPFWSFQIGVQYANEWTADDYEDRWSGVIAFQGVAPLEVELDASLYVSEDSDATVELEAEYDLRITQRLVLQPRAEIGIAAQDIPERNLGAGITDTDLDLRLRYEIKREFAPYIGIRCRFLVGETGNIAEASGTDTEQLFFLAGLRFAF